MIAQMVRLFGFAVSIAVTGCAGLRPKALNVSMKSFNEIPASEELGPIAILPIREEVRYSLEFRSYIAVVEDALRRRGVTVVALLEHPRLVGFLDTGIDNGQPVVSMYAIPRDGRRGLAQANCTRMRRRKPYSQDSVCNPYWTLHYCP